MSVRTRFAPSPTGLLHIGNFRTALINYLFTLKHGGEFMLRMDDTDPERSKVEYEEKIIEDLKWLGFDWQVFARQSERIERYEEVKRILIEQGRLYPCYESQEELEVKRKMQLSRGKPPIYDRSALKLSDEQISKFEDDGKKPHFRFKMLEQDIIWNDMVRGETKFHGSNISDPILIREDGSMTYILCSVVDDIDFEITHILRGEDHVTNTAVQIQIFEALDASHPEFGHTTLIKTKDSGISKRSGGFDIATLRSLGIEPMALCSLFAKIGTSDAIAPYINFGNLVEEFSIDKFGRAPANYDSDDLENINHKIISMFDFEVIRERLDNLGLEQIDEVFWNGIKGNINSISEAAEWWQICNNNIEPVIDNPKYLELAANLLENKEFDINTWDEWIKQVKDQSGLKGKELFMPLRKALTGKEHGPELKYMLAYIGYERAYKRLMGEVA